MRKNLINAIHHFDSQLSEINECSNIYELDLGTRPFERPVTVTLPLPKWYTQMIERMQAPPSPSPSGPDNTDGGGATAGGSGDLVLDLDENDRDSRTRAPTPSESPEGRKKSKENVNQANVNVSNEIPLEERPKNLVLVYQAGDILYNHESLSIVAVYCIVETLVFRHVRLKLWWLQPD